MLAIVLNSDFGSLGEAAYLVRDTGVRAILLMPERLYSVVKSTVDVPHAAYSNLSEVSEVLHHVNADAVILASAYIYGLNKLLAPYQTLKLLEYLEGRGTRVAVSDPFANYWSGFDALSNIGDLRQSRMAAIVELAFLSGQLARYPHLYPYAMDGRSDRVVQPFFNPAIALAEDRRARFQARVDTALGGVSADYWFFFLSTVEYDKLCSLSGADGALQLISSRIADAGRNGRTAVLVAPQHCIQGLERSGMQNTGVCWLFSHCGFELFRAFMWCAEYVFSWNALSFSVLERVYNGRAVFFFDRGHFHDLLPSLHQHVAARWYRGCELPLLDPRQPLDSSRLDAEWERVGKNLVSGYRQGLERLPAASEVLAAFMDGK